MTASQLAQALTDAHTRLQASTLGPVRWCPIAQAYRPATGNKR